MCLSFGVWDEVLRSYCRQSAHTALWEKHWGAYNWECSFPGWSWNWAKYAKFYHLFKQCLIRGKKGLSAGPLRPFKGSNLPVHSNTWLPPTWGAIETETIVGLQADPSCRENSPWRAELALRGNEPEKEEMARGSYALALPIEAIYMADNRMRPQAADKHPSAAETQAWPAPANGVKQSIGRNLPFPLPSSGCA